MRPGAGAFLPAQPCRLTPHPLTCSSKATGDPWLTDGSYLDGSGFARIGMESQIGTTKRFEQELRLVSSSGIVFFLQHQARGCPPRPPVPILSHPRATLPHANPCAPLPRPPSIPAPR